ncbi:MAG: DUF3037 domain-containing protein [Myxococcota bacterium]
MTSTRGFFSVIQFCPDLDRGECANVGVVLAVPGLGYLGVRFGEDNEAPKQRFGRDAFDDGRLSLAKTALEGRIRDEGPAWVTADDLVRFGKKEGNNLLLSLPRTILVENCDVELEELYLRLAHVDARTRRRPRKPDLRGVFERKLMGVPLRRDLTVEIPEIGSMEVPYAYQNGALNLIKPEAFPVDAGSAGDRASDLAVKGHLIHKHSIAIGSPQKLIVVGGFDESIADDVKRRIAYVLQEHDARLVREDELEDFAEEVRREAHQ